MGGVVCEQPTPSPVQTRGGGELWSNTRWPLIIAHGYAGCYYSALSNAAGDGSDQYRTVRDLTEGRQPVAVLRS